MAKVKTDVAAQNYVLEPTADLVVLSIAQHYLESLKFRKATTIYDTPEEAARFRPKWGQSYARGVLQAYVAQKVRDESFKMPSESPLSKLQIALGSGLHVSRILLMRKGSRQIIIVCISRCLTWVRKFKMRKFKVIGLLMSPVTPLLRLQISKRFSSLNMTRTMG